MPFAGGGQPEREEPLTFDLSLARRDVIKAAGAGLAGGLPVGATAQARTPAASPRPGEFRTAESTARKDDVSLRLYRSKRVGASSAGGAKLVLLLVLGSSNGAQSTSQFRATANIRQ